MLFLIILKGSYVESWEIIGWSFVLSHSLSLSYTQNFVRLFVFLIFHLEIKMHSNPVWCFQPFFDCLLLKICCWLLDFHIKNKSHTFWLFILLMCSSIDAAVMLEVVVDFDFINQKILLMRTNLWLIKLKARLLDVVCESCVHLEVQTFSHQ